MKTSKTNPMTNKTDTEMIQSAILFQQTTNKRIAKALKCDDLAAYTYSMQAHTGVYVPLRADLIVSLAILCHKIGVDRFSTSLLPGMINNNHTKSNIKDYIKAMMDNTSLHLSAI